MLPDRHSVDSHAPQLAQNADIPSAILLELGNPKFSSILRNVSRASSAPVPEASIYKDGELRFRKEEVWSAYNVRGMFLPSSNFALTQDGFDKQFCRPVAFAANFRHVNRAFASTQLVVLFAMQTAGA